MNVVLVLLFLALSASSGTGAAAFGFLAHQDVQQLIQEERWSEAEAYFRRLQSENRLTSADLDAAAEASRRLDNWQRVVELYRAFPLNPDQRLQLYEAYLRIGEEESAASELAQVMSVRPDEERLVHLMAFLHLSQGRPKQALATYDAFLKRNPSAYRSNINSALILFRLEQTGEALARLGRAFRQAPREGNVYFHRQLIRNTKSMTPHDIAALAGDVRAELGLAPAEDETFSLLGREYRNLNRNQDAIISFREALKRRPDDTPMRLELSRLLLQSGQSEEAFREIRPLLERKDAVGRQANLFAAELAVKAERFDEARARLAQLPPSDRRLPIALFVRALIALDADDTETALPLLEEVVRRKPELTEALFHLGRLYIRLGRRDEGRQALARFQRLKK